jgi:transcriptional regulator GlxA family with amidase domain
MATWPGDRTAPRRCRRRARRWYLDPFCHSADRDREIVAGERVSGVLDAGIPDAQMSDHVVSEPGGTCPPTLRRALAFIHDHADGDIGLSDIAAAADLTPRSVQYLFRRYLGATPLEYLRRIRLDHAHRDLQAADPSVDTVNAIAGRWGFTHAGRFSIAYKQKFGTAPSATLRN